MRLFTDVDLIAKSFAGVINMTILHQLLVRSCFGSKGTDNIIALNIPENCFFDYFP